MVNVDECHLVADDSPLVADHREGHEHVLLIIIAGDSAVGSDPDIAYPVLLNAENVIRRQAQILPVIHPERRSVVPVHALRRPYPDEAAGILVDLVDGVKRKPAVLGTEVHELVRRRKRLH